LGVGAAAAAALLVVDAVVAVALALPVAAVLAAALLVAALLALVAALLVTAVLALAAGLLVAAVLVLGAALVVPLTAAFPPQAARDTAPTPATMAVKKRRRERSVSDGRPNESIATPSSTKHPGTRSSSKTTRT